MTEIKPFQTILYATNIGDTMRPVFRQALNMARIHNAKIIMLHAVAPIGTTGQAILSMYLPDKEVNDIEQETMNQVIETMRERLRNYGNNVEADFMKDKDQLIDKIAVSAGNPADVILHYAEHHPIDLIVIGSHTRPVKHGAMLGSTARGVTLHSKVPVLIVPNGE